jgi:predicted nucleotidyltransferase
MAEGSALLPEAVRTALSEFTAAARQAFADDLRSVVLFGSAAEGRMRQSSDVNVVVVLRRVDPARLEAIGEAYRLAHAAIRLSAMFILDSEIEVAKDAFAVKFADITTRHEVLYGDDPFVGSTISREAALHRLLQGSSTCSCGCANALPCRRSMASSWRWRLPMRLGRCEPVPRCCCGSNRVPGLLRATHCAGSRTRLEPSPPSRRSRRRAKAAAFQPRALSPHSLAPSNWQANSRRGPNDLPR